jgi:DNA-directed RNA polymerase subunit RPC12/RpoP
MGRVTGVKKKKGPRSARRAAERAAEKLVVQRKKLARLEAGGGPERPLEVASSSVVEARAENDPCLRCGERVKAVDHRAETIDERRLRVVTARCPRCGTRRVFYFRIGTALAN